MEVNKKITKIVVSKEDELTDIISGIVDSVNERIVLTFAEDSDLLISPINLKVILETADEQEKLLITQIIKNPTGVRNATLAGLAVIETPNLPTENMWEDENMARVKRSTKDKDSILATKKEEVKEEVSEEIEPTEFQKRINEAVERSRQKETSTDTDKEIKEDDIAISIDEDIPITYEEESSNISTIQKNNQIKKSANTLLIKLESFFSIITTKFSSNKAYSLVLGSLVLVGILGVVIYYFTAPFVRVNIYIKAKEANIEKIFDGDENIKEINFEELKIPVKRENTEKSSSTTIKATGTAFKGDKAKGTVTITYLSTTGCQDVEPIKIPSGTTLTASVENKGYKADSEVTIECNQKGDINVTAVDVGQEFNLPTGTYFVVQGFQSGKVFGTSSKDISGGNKKEYTVLTQTDINNGAEELKKQAYEEGEREMKDKSGGTWELIKESLISEVVKDSIETSKKVGEEADQVDLSLKIKTSGTFYMKEGFDNGVAELLTKEAREKNLFEKDNDLELVLSDDITKEISVAENNNNGVKIKLTAKASVKPKVVKEEIVSKLKKMSWSEGNEYLKNLPYSEKASEVEFNPKNFSEKLRYFPKKQGGIIIEVKEVF